MEESCPGDFQTSKHAWLYRSNIRIMFNIQRISACMGFINGLHCPRQHSWATTGPWGNGRINENPQITCPSSDKWSNWSKKRSSTRTWIRSLQVTCFKVVVLVRCNACSRPSWSCGCLKKAEMQKKKIQEFQTKSALARRHSFANSIAGSEKQSSPPLMQRPFKQDEHLSHLPIKEPSNRVWEFVNSQLWYVKPHDVKLKESSKQQPHSRTWQERSTLQQARNWLSW